jgi:glycosyltransferase involved in cell wall biosynthesis
LVRSVSCMGSRDESRASRLGAVTGESVTRQRISVVLPVYNEVGGIERLIAALFEVLDPLPYAYTIVTVNDGSTDGTTELLRRLHAAYPERIAVLHLSRNFGHQAALTAGMDYADGDAVICMDADMQHPPSLIPAMLERWQQGFDIVHTVRRRTATIGRFKGLTATAFYALINALSSTRIEPNSADFRLLSRRVVEVFRQDVRERDRFLRGLVAWVGFRSCCVEFDPGVRFAGQSKYSLRKMLSFARTGLISFSKMPLKVAVVVGFVVSALSLLYGGYVVFAYLFFNAVIPGWASTVLVGSFLGGCQLLFLGLIGEYIATIFDEVKGRPLYIVATVQPAAQVTEAETPYSEQARDR